MPRKKKTPDFEQSLSELEALVSRMELTLDDSLSAFEDGIRLPRECQSFLDQAEQKVQILSTQDGKITTEPFVSEQD
jgi:exodeoxyribonuclease VII small subunit